LILKDQMRDTYKNVLIDELKQSVEIKQRELEQKEREQREREQKEREQKEL